MQENMDNYGAYCCIAIEYKVKSKKRRHDFQKALSTQTVAPKPDSRNGKANLTETQNDENSLSRSDESARGEELFVCVNPARN